MFKMLAYSIVAAFVTSFLFHVIMRTPTIATVDVAQVTALFIKEEAKKNHSETEKKIAIKAFSAALEKSLQQLSDKNALVLLPKEAVFKGSPDYTEQLIAIIALEKKP